ncbi:hypothetical protein [Marinicauda sp. Alg238-R41]|uniref:hypothetical protein n=1 Tax=Marinicauda sp. Alg238-R41 TaxID=2993447 RepID=UPI0022E7AAD9|nr:hypothetical protein [Marinicauda sp. Alg238-R41]
MFTHGLHIPMTILAAALSAAGVGLLFASWTKRAGRHDGSLWVGWGTLVISLPVWIVASGPDRGVAMAALMAMIAALVVLAVQYARPDGPVRRNASRAESTASQATLSAMKTVRTVYAGVLATVFAGVAAVALSASIYGLMLGAGAPQPDALLGGLFFFVLGWGVLAVVATIDIALRWRSIAMVTIVVLSAGLLLLTRTLT